MNGFKVLVNHYAFEYPPIVSFNVKLVTQHDERPLHTYAFQHRSMDEGIKLIEEYKKVILQPKVLMVLMAKDISKMLGFEINLNEGLDTFYMDMAAHLPSEDLEWYLKQVDDETLISLLSNEIENRKA